MTEVGKNHGADAVNIIPLLSELIGRPPEVMAMVALVFGVRRPDFMKTS